MRIVQGMGVKENLAWLLEKRGMNPNSLADATGVPQPTIFRILNGHSRDPRGDTLKPLADYFRVTVSQLRETDLKAKEPGAPYEARIELTQEERELLIDFRELLPEQREVIVAQIRQEADHARRIMAQARARLGISEPIPDERVNGLLPSAPPYILPAPISTDHPARKKVHKK